MYCFYIYYYNFIIGLKDIYNLFGKHKILKW